MHRPSDLQEFLNRLGIKPKKRLSQNFLIDGNIIQKILSTAQVNADDCILEIGPGPGALTQQLLESGATVIAVEKDEVFANELKRLDHEKNQLMVLCQDILKVDMNSIIDRSKGRKIKVVANLPYHITTPILTQLIPMHEAFSSITVMVQDEVARRFTASPRSKEYGSITVFLNYYSSPKYAFKISKHCFYPRPKVSSAVVHFEVGTKHQVSNEELFFKMTRTAFKERRKMIKSTLKKLYPESDIIEALESMGFSPKARPEELSPKQFVAFFEWLQPI